MERLFCFTIIDYFIVYLMFDIKVSLDTSVNFFPFIFISWRLITLQYCSVFRHTLT